MTTTQQRHLRTSGSTFTGLFLAIMSTYSVGAIAESQPSPQARLTITDEQQVQAPTVSTAPESALVQVTPATAPSVAIVPVTAPSEPAMPITVVPPPPVSIAVAPAVAAVEPVPVASSVAPSVSGAVISAPTSVSSVPASKAVVLVGGKTFPANSGFPQTGFTGATFQVLMNGRDAQANGQYQWHSNQGWVSVDATGSVTFTGMPTSQAKSVVVTATPMTGGAPQAMTLTVNRWFINAKAEKMTAPAAMAWCHSQGDGFAVPDAGMMTATTEGALSLRGANGKLWNEWGPMALYRSGWQLDNYWGAKVQPNTREMVGLVGGSFYWVPDSSQYLVACTRAL